MMLNPPRHTAVLNWLGQNSQRPARAMLLWAWCLKIADRHEGMVPLDRKQLAIELRVTPADVSRMLGELVKTRGLIRERGEDGKWQYRVNRLVATDLPEEIRTPLQLTEPEVVGVTGLWPHVPRAVDPADENGDILVRLRT